MFWMVFFSFWQAGNCAVFLESEDRTVSVLGEHLEPVLPQRGDRVKFLVGEDREATGQLLSIDSQEGVVKMDASDEIKMIPLNYLCKMRFLGWFRVRRERRVNFYWNCLRPCEGGRFFAFLFLCIDLSILDSDWRWIFLFFLVIFIALLSAEIR